VLFNLGLIDAGQAIAPVACLRPVHIAWSGSIRNQFMAGKLLIFVMRPASAS
jgi:hypothetical protein